MSDSTSYPFERGAFLCSDGECNKLFYALREKGEIFQEDGDFFALCPSCGHDGMETHYMRNLHKTVGTAKGANMSEEARQKTRLNGFTTGSALLSKYHEGKIPMPPAKPDKYDECDDCQDLEACKANVEAQKGTSVPVYCHRKGEVALKYVAAFLSKDPEQLRMMSAINNANMQQLLNNSFRAIFERGVELVETVLHYGEKGVLLKDENGNAYTTLNISAHPLIKRCIEIMTSMGYGLNDWTMTTKSKEAKEQVAGFLASTVGNGIPLEEVTEKIDATVKNFGSLLQKAAQMREQDKTLQVFEKEQGEREADEKP